jgi:hypothetical protein
VEPRYQKMWGFIQFLGVGTAFNLKSPEYIEVNKNYTGNFRKTKPTDALIYPIYSQGFPPGIQYPAMNSYTCIKSLAYGIRKAMRDGNYTYQQLISGEVKKQLTVDKFTDNGVYKFYYFYIHS